MDDIIKDIYFKEDGFGSMNETLAEARKVNPAITLEDVRLWKEKFIPRKGIALGCIPVP